MSKNARVFDVITKRGMVCSSGRKIRITVLHIYKWDSANFPYTVRSYFYRHLGLIRGPEIDDLSGLQLLSHWKKMCLVNIKIP